MEILQLGWEKEILPGLEYHEIKDKEPFHVLKDNNEIFGLVFMNRIDANQFYEEVEICLRKISNGNKNLQMKIQPPDIDSLQHVSGIKRKSGKSFYEVVNHLPEIEDSNLRKIFSRPFKSDKDAQVCIEKILTKTRKHSMTDIEKLPLYARISKLEFTEKQRRANRLSAIKQTIGSPDWDSLQHVQGVSNRQIIDNVDQLPPVARKMFSTDPIEN